MSIPDVLGSSLSPLQAADTVLVLGAVHKAQKFQQYPVGITLKAYSDRLGMQPGWIICLVQELTPSTTETEYGDSS